MKKLTPYIIFLALLITGCNSFQRQTSTFDNQVNIQDSPMNTPASFKDSKKKASKVEIQDSLVDINGSLNVNQVIFIRHAEKENEDGTIQQVDLSAKGYKRANELPNFFMNHLPDKIHKPDLVIAMKQSRKKTSNRPVETVQPLAKEFNIPVYAEYTQQQTDLAVREINQYGKDKTVLVCWEHEELVEIAKLMGVPVKSWGNNPNAKKSDDANYDAIWVLTKTGSNKAIFSVYKQFSIGNNGEISYTN